MIFALSCIDFRFDEMISEYFREIRQEFNYFNCAMAGATLPLGYEKYTKKDCCKKCSSTNPTMELFKQSIIENINIALSLKEIDTIYLVNHQDCGAFKAFLKCSDYPKTVGSDKEHEIEINQKILLYAKEYIVKKYKIKCVMALIDVGGTVATFSEKTNKWTIIYVGKYEYTIDTDGTGLWFGYYEGSIYPK